MPSLMNICQSSLLGGIFSKETKPLVKTVQYESKYLGASIPDSHKRLTQDSLFK